MSVDFKAIVVRPFFEDVKIHFHLCVFVHGTVQTCLKTFTVYRRSDVLVATIKVSPSLLS